MNSNRKHFYDIFRVAYGKKTTPDWETELHMLQIKKVSIITFCTTEETTQISKKSNNKIDAGFEFSCGWFSKNQHRLFQ